ncbi:ABC transporter permease [Phytohabitans flavus]|uniref:ABC transporter permease n=1 Tax=Phytohabitans flavus TaxID=1076124 RepID=UPI003644B313
MTLARHTLKARWASFVGSFLALSLGVALFATAGLTLAAVLSGPDEPPRWFVSPSVVVAGPDGAGVTAADPDGPAANPGLPPGERGYVPDGAAAALTGIEGVSGVVVDRAGYASFGSATEAHPWAASALHPHRMVAGDRPTSDNQVVLTAPTDQKPGDTVTLSTVDGPRDFTVSGVIETEAEPAVYVSEATAEQLAKGRVSAVALLAAPGADPAAIGDRAKSALRGQFPQLRVVTGDARRTAEADPEAGLLIATVSLVGSTAGLAGFVSTFVVAGTFAFTVAQRRREFALLRTAGATPRQVRRIVINEAALVGVLAAAAGGALSVVLAPVFARWLADKELAPAGFTAEFVWWPVLAAGGLGLIVALVGAWFAARRAGKVRPIEALREATVDRRSMTILRWVLGLACIGGIFPLAPLLSTPEERLPAGRGDGADPRLHPPAARNDEAVRLDDDARQRRGRGAGQVGRAHREQAVRVDDRPGPHHDRAGRRLARRHRDHLRHPGRQPARPAHRPAARGAGRRRPAARDGGRRGQGRARGQRHGTHQDQRSLRQRAEHDAAAHRVVHRRAQRRPGAAPAADRRNVRRSHRRDRRGQRGDGRRTRVEAR